LACIGFGFDAKTNDYKIINIRFLFHPHSNSRNYPYQNYSYQKAVYSLNADSWRIVDWEHRRVHFLTDDYKGPMTYVNGVASWRVLGDGYDWGGVLSFDMSDEVFLETPLPDVVMKNRHPNFWEELFLLNESIAMPVSSHSEEWSNVCFDIWLLLEVGVKDSWTKLFTIGPGIPRPLGFWKNGTMFLENVNGLVLYDPSTKEMTDLQIHHRHRDSMQLVTYMETLVSVKERNEFEEQDI
jgi:F-box interacting protein